MKKVILIVASSWLFANATAANEPFPHIEEGAEVMELTLKENGSQLVYARVCDNCKMLALTVDNKTRIYADRKPISLSQAAALTNRGGTLFFDPQTREVNRIVFWRASRDRT